MYWRTFLYICTLHYVTTFCYYLYFYYITFLICIPLRFIGLSLFLLKSIRQRCCLRTLNRTYCFMWIRLQIAILRFPYIPLGDVLNILLRFVILNSLLFGPGCLFSGLRAPSTLLAVMLAYYSLLPVISLWDYTVIYGPCTLSDVFILYDCCSFHMYSSKLLRDMRLY